MAAMLPRQAKAGVTMFGVPAHCPHCGYTFFSKNTIIGCGVQISFIGSTVTCDRCGNEAQVLDGTFEFLDDGLHVQSAPPATIAILRAFQAALKQTQEGMSEDEILRSLKETSPEAALTAEPLIRRLGLGGFVLLVLYMLSNCTNTNANVDVNLLLDQLRHYATSDEPHPAFSRPRLDERAQPDRSGQGAEPEPSRQQRRQQERQAKKQQRQSERQTLRTPRG
jgi:hypothetical protein